MTATMIVKSAAKPTATRMNFAQSGNSENMNILATDYLLL